MCELATTVVKINLNSTTESVFIFYIIFSLRNPGRKIEDFAMNLSNFRPLSLVSIQLSGVGSVSVSFVAIEIFGWSDYHRPVSPLKGNPEGRLL